MLPIGKVARITANRPVVGKPNQAHSIRAIDRKHAAPNNVLMNESIKNIEGLKGNTLAKVSEINKENYGPSSTREIAKTNAQRPALKPVTAGRVSKNVESTSQKEVPHKGVKRTETVRTKKPTLEASKNSVASENRPSTHGVKRSVPSHTQTGRQLQPVQTSKRPKIDSKRECRAKGPPPHNKSSPPQPYQGCFSNTLVSLQQFKIVKRTPQTHKQRNVANQPRKQNWVKALAIQKRRK